MDFLRKYDGEPDVSGGNHSSPRFTDIEMLTRKNNQVSDKKMGMTRQKGEAHYEEERTNKLGKLKFTASNLNDEYKGKKLSAETLEALHAEHAGQGLTAEQRSEIEKDIKDYTIKLGKGNFEHCGMTVDPVKQKF